MNQQLKTFRRIVTGHDADGKAIIISDAPPVFTQLMAWRNSFFLSVAIAS